MNVMPIYQKLNAISLSFKLTFNYEFFFKTKNISLCLIVGAKWMAVWGKWKCV